MFQEEFICIAEVLMCNTELLELCETVWVYVVLCIGFVA